MDARLTAPRNADEVPEVEADLRINQVVTDVPFGDDEVTQPISTRPPVGRHGSGLLDDADVTVTTDYETARRCSSTRIPPSRCSRS